MDIIINNLNIKNQYFRFFDLNTLVTKKNLDFMATIILLNYVIILNHLLLHRIDA